MTTNISADTPILAEALAEGAHTSVKEVDDIFTNNPDTKVAEFIVDFTDVK